MKKIYYLVVVLGLIMVSCKKKGCMDINAKNYSEEAEKDDGSCEYWPVWTSDFTPPSGLPSGSYPNESPAEFRLMTATSSNGFDWTATGNIVTDQGNVSDMMLRNDSIFLYYTAWTAGQYENLTVLAVSGDNGNSWIYKHLNFTGYSAEDPLVNNGDPDIIVLEDGTIRMFITTDINGKKSVLCFEGTDGINFEFVDVALHNPTKHMFDSNTFWYNNQWHQYSIQGGPSSLHWYATSSDGVHFTETGTYAFLNGADSMYVSNGYVTGNSYRIFTTHFQGGGIGSMTTSDGANWTVEPGLRLSFGTVAGENQHIKDPSILQLSDGTLLMVYSTKMQ